MASEFGYIKCYVQYVVTGPDLGGGAGPQASHQQAASHQTPQGEGKGKEEEDGRDCPPPF